MYKLFPELQVGHFIRVKFSMIKLPAMEATAVVICCLNYGKDFGVNGYSTGWFNVKLCAKCMMHSRYRVLFC